MRAKSDDDLRDVVTRLWQMAVGIEDGNISDAQDALRNAENALQQALERGASDEEIKQLMDQLRAAMDRFMQALGASSCKNNQQLARPLDPNTQHAEPARPAEHARPAGEPGAQRRQGRRAGSCCSSSSR